MIGKPHAQQAIATLFLLSIPVMTSGRVLNAGAQAAKSQSSKPHTPFTPPKIYEDDEIKVPIPSGWSVATEDHLAVGPYSGTGSSITSGAKGKLLLSKDGYTLTLAYDTEHVSGIDGGRFIEMLRIPWLDADDAWTCSQYLSQRPQPVSRALMLINLTFRTEDAKVQTNCGIPKDLGYLSNKGKLKQIIGTHRWFAASFTTASEGWFFPSDGVGCREKVYTLTTKATKPEELPDPDDRALKKIISEAIDIVASIRYKRCPPSTAF